MRPSARDLNGRPPDAVLQGMRPSARDLNGRPPDTVLQGMQPSARELNGRPPDPVVVGSRSRDPVVESRASRKLCKRMGAMGLPRYLAKGGGWRLPRVPCQGSGFAKVSCQGQEGLPRIPGQVGGWFQPSSLLKGCWRIKLPPPPVTFSVNDLGRISFT